MERKELMNGNVKWLTLDEIRNKNIKTEHWGVTAKIIVKAETPEQAMEKIQRRFPYFPVAFLSFLPVTFPKNRDNIQ